LKNKGTMQKKNSLAIIPARGGSKSIKNKNIKLFNGKPLIAWTIELALESDFNRVIVTTDSEEIAEIAVKYGAEVPFLRSKNLASDNVAIEPVMIDVLDYLKKSEGYYPHCAGLLLPTSPFRVVNDVNNAIEIYNVKQPASVVSVSPATAGNNPYWMLKKDKLGRVTMINGDGLSKFPSRRQDLPECFIKNDFIFVINPKNLYSKVPNLYGDNVELLVIPEERFEVDINNTKDWMIAEKLFQFV
jgi:CMP-N,N'-diacetyllegionaminic acid synthase